MTFRKRLTLFSAAGIALVLVVGSVATYLVVRSQLRGEIDQSLRTQSALALVRAGSGGGLLLHTQFERQVEPGGASPALGVLSQITPESEFGTAPILYLIINDETAMRRSLGAPTLPVTDRALEVARSGTGAFFTDVEVRGTPLRMYVQPAGAGQALLAARSLAEVDEALSKLGWSLAITCLAGIAVAAFVGAMVARGALTPVRKLTDTAERISDTHDLSQRIHTEGEDELSRLGTTFNAMLDSLEGGIRSQRQLVADASHELRTPLTSLRTNTDLLRQGVKLDERDRDRLLRDVGTEIEELTNLVANLADLARGSQRDLHLGELRLDEVAEEVVDRARVRFPKLELSLDAESTTVLGDPEEVGRAVWNLVENAAKWSDGGGRVELTVVGGEVTVRDHGPGVAPADRPFIFDRFYRSEAARAQPGSGLGLAIVRQIAESHGGRVEVEEAEGGGARFRLALQTS